MKGSRLYNINPALNQWEEQQYKKLMAKKIKGAKSTLAGHAGSKQAKPAGGKGCNNRSSIPHSSSSGCGQHGNGSNAAPTAAARV
ncbi:hypothetical protein OEZ85_000555 [Tetradesmus obliquus]|uniref:Ribosome biogenesis regulatory protein n=1 Tax=Tetradesmus obliquus TaxID=3088 RepID=A0ABY8UIG3_TETOB|nr:hypothetical protein OEZ85_000555 [Tetradesmus obliquus]